MAKYEFIDSCVANDSAVVPITDRCRCLAVFTSGFYHWKSRPKSAIAIRRDTLAQRIRMFFGLCTARTETATFMQICEQPRLNVPRNWVRSIMRDEDLAPCQPGPFRGTTDSDPNSEPVVPDLLVRDFSADRPGAKFLGDIIYIHTWQGFVDLATVIDCYSRKVVGWSIADHMRTELVAAR